ncbi:hypothetical protein [Polyangium sp. 15x6]|uniref:hypothetical protein n=1 Tax=Polyangium sp. 15x6 TaxID=3042687 RepID=UPI00249A198D|nr:hypothetical protein [Polyangium sp. 15x6]MDI3285159.1 hypothetical protein [Polyangium sp. 15x6]
MRNINELGALNVKRWFTRSQAAKALGIGLTAWLTLERRGLVTPVPVSQARGFKGRPGGGKQPLVVIRAEDVARMKDAELVKRMSNGQLAGAAFEMFEKGKSVVDVVIALRLPPERAEELHEAWRRARGGVLLPLACAEKMRELGFDVTDEGTFVAAVDRLMAAARAGFRLSARVG